jgi:hypothetical protein
VDGDSSHTAKVSQALASQVQIQLLRLPKQAPELNPMDTLWKRGKDVISANKQHARLDDQVELFITHLSSLLNKEALETSGVLSKKFWLKRVLSKNFLSLA